MNFAHGRPITVFSGRTLDRYGDPDLDSPITTHVIEGCSWFPRTAGAGPASGDLDGRGRQGVIVGLTLFLPSIANLTHADQAALDARLTASDYENADLWEVDGEPGEWVSPFTGWHAGCEVAIRRAQG